MLEAVPNVSDGRDAGVIAATGEAFAARALVLDVHSDPDHHRSVFTLAAPQSELVEALIEGIAAAVERIDLREHVGVHPRVGVADVVPVVPLAPKGMQDAVDAARTLAQRIGTELGLPVFRYAELGGGRRPAYFRRGGLAELTRRVELGELVPDDGPRRVDPRSGVVLVGARTPLVAYNVELGTDDVEVAQSIAAAVRESSGGVPGVQAIGLKLPATGRMQVSMNILDVSCAPLHEVVGRVRDEARARGTEVVGGELVGLVPASVLHAAREAGATVPGIDGSRVLEDVLSSRLAEWPGRPS